METTRLDVNNLQETEEVGLRKNLEHQNTSLLMKFVHKLHTVHKNSWVDWTYNSYFVVPRRLGGNVPRG
jgi:hypothetical protein